MAKNNCPPSFLTFPFLLWLAGCDAHHEKLSGPYLLRAVDTEDQMAVQYDLGNSDSVGRIGPTVFSVGWNNRYIVARQHPSSSPGGYDKLVTNYYYLDRTLDGKYADPSASVTGPLTENQFLQKQKELSLPGFKVTISDLR